MIVFARRCILTAVMLVAISTSTTFAGEYAAEFLTIGSSARILAMGRAGVAAVGEGNSFSWNPGGLFHVEESQFNFHHLVYSRSLAEYNYLGYLACLPMDARLGLNWIRFGVDDIPIFPDPDDAGSDYGKSDPSKRLDGVPDGTFSSVDNAFVLSFSKGGRTRLDMGWIYLPISLEFSFGGNIKYIAQKIHKNRGNGVGLDIGGLLGIHLGHLLGSSWLELLFIGLNIQDVGGTTVMWDTQSHRKDEIGQNVKYGGGMFFPIPFLESRLFLSVEDNFRKGGGGGAGPFWGFEYGVRESVFFRLGRDESDFTAGVGVLFWKLKFDYAFVPNEMVNTHRLDIGVLPFR